MTNARVRFEVVRHAIQHPKLGLDYIPRTPGVAIEVVYDLGDEIQARELLESSIGEARVMMNQIVAKLGDTAKRDWASDQVTPAEVAFIHPQAAKEPPSDESWIQYRDHGGRKWWRKSHD